MLQWFWKQTRKVNLRCLNYLNLLWFKVILWQRLKCTKPHKDLFSILVGFWDFLCLGQSLCQHVRFVANQIWETYIHPPRMKAVINFAFLLITFFGQQITSRATVNKHDTKKKLVPPSLNILLLYKCFSLFIKFFKVLIISLLTYS
jgi:succinate dehydrogenase hydrophobic anchor subunit